MKNNKDAFDGLLHLLYAFLVIGGIIFAIFLYLLSQVEMGWMSWIL